MMSRPTVFILGAGAAVSYGFPAGIDLTKNICMNVWNGNYLKNVAKEISPQWELDARELADRLAGATISIDSWLAHRMDQERNISKYLVSREILGHEQKCARHPGDRQKSPRLAPHPLPPFAV